MADEDTKPIVPDAKPKRGAAPAPDPQPTTDKSADAKPASGLDGALESIRGENSVRDGVRVMADRLAQLFTDAAIESPDAAERLAIELRNRENDFADAVQANVADANDGALKAPAPATDDDVARLEAMNHAEPHNDAAAAAVAGGMDTKTANEMTAPGANI